MSDVTQLLARVQELEDEGYVVVLKWDGEREKGKKTLFVSKPPAGPMVRRNGDDMWQLLEDLLKEFEEKKNA